MGPVVAGLNDLEEPVGPLERFVRENADEGRRPVGFHTGFRAGRSGSGPVFFQVDRVAGGDYWYYRIALSRDEAMRGETLRFDLAAPGQLAVRPGQVMLVQEGAGETTRFTIAHDADGRITRVTARHERRRMFRSEALEISGEFR
jgi:hypothetical protein